MTNPDTWADAQASALARLDRQIDDLQRQIARLQARRDQIAAQQ